MNAALALRALLHFFAHLYMQLTHKVLRLSLLVCLITAAQELPAEEPARHAPQLCGPSVWQVGGGPAQPRGGRTAAETAGARGLT
jgi:hypothetical protein